MISNFISKTTVKAIIAIIATINKAINVVLLVFFFIGLAEEFTVGFSTVAGSVNDTLGVLGAESVNVSAALASSPVFSVGNTIATTSRRRSNAPNGA